ncbi:MAG: polysaccharide deacetylase 2 family uncharacterized protein YibQ [Pseudohongiellaceae bacterium]|jgi:polysaccharide deacetylase 2 family uncharacterized protein YibQ
MNVIFTFIGYSWLFIISQLSFGQNHGEVSLPPAPTVMIVIDDIGHNLVLGKQAIALPGPIHFAILPHSQYGAELATLAHQQGKEVLLHVPMSTVNGRSAGPGELSAKLSQRQFVNTLNHNLNSIPHLNGVNNHMGSLLTQMPEPMSWLMREVKKRHLYFLDSRTSALTVAEQTAKQFDIPNLKRDIFLDNDRNVEAIHIQFERLLQLATQNGHAVAIGHPYPETLAVLKETLPALSLRGYQLKFVSTFLKPTQPNCHSYEQLLSLPKQACKPRSALKVATTIQRQTINKAPIK